jgi:catalase
MQSVLKGTVQKAGEAVSGAMESNKKISDLQHEYRTPKDSTVLTSDTGVKEPTHDIWLSASTGDRQGPQLLEDNFARQKLSIVCCQSMVSNVQADHEI